MVLMKGGGGVNIKDPGIQIRILKALDENKPFGLFKNFYMIKVLKNLKKPNIITSLDVWNYLYGNFEVNRYDEEADKEIIDLCCYFEDVYKG